MNLMFNITVSGAELCTAMINCYQADEMGGDFQWTARPANKEMVRQCLQRVLDALDIAEVS